MADSTSEFNKIVDGGWARVVGYIQEQTQCMLYLLDDIRTNRTDPLNMWEHGQLGILHLDNRDDAEDALAALVDYEPCDSAIAETATGAEFTFPQGKFAPLDDSDFEQVCTNVASNWRMLHRVVEALLRPGMPDPSLADIGSVFVEAARYIGVADLVRVAVETDLVIVSTREVTKDPFGVGKKIALFASEVLPAHATEAEGAISIPEDPSLDTAIAAYLSVRLLKNTSGHIFIPRSNQFDPKSTNVKKHCTIGCGVPFHDPTLLGIDCRIAEGDLNNTQLVSTSLSDSGADMAYANELIQWSTQPDEHNSFPNLLFAELKKIADTVPLAMNAWQLYLDIRFPVRYSEEPAEKTSGVTETLRKLDQHHPVNNAT